jgi:nucleoside-diphosphate-sugar epimerase
VTETTPVPDAVDNPRIQRLANAEGAVLAAGGCCLRLAGLYNLHRGAHSFWLKKGTVSGSKQGLINQLHYDDAAGACVAALRAGPARTKGKVFLISDGNPLTRYEICQAALKAKDWSGYSMPEFPGTDDFMADGKVYDGSASNEELMWAPKYKSFAAFMESNA